MPPRRPLIQLNTFPPEVLAEIARQVYDPRPLEYFAPHVGTSSPRPAWQTETQREDLASLGSVSRQFRAVSKPLLFGSIWLDDVKALTRFLAFSDLTTLVRFAYIDFDGFLPDDLLRFLLLIQCLLNKSPLIVHLSFFSSTHNPFTQDHSYKLFSLSAAYALPSLCSLELNLPLCNECSFHLLQTFKECNLRHLKITEATAAPHGWPFQASYMGSQDPQLFPVGLRTLFVAVATRRAARTELLKRLATNCPLLEDIRIHCPGYYVSSRKDEVSSVADSSQTLQQVLKVLGTFKYLHTVDIDRILPKATSPWTPSSSEVLDDKYDGEENVFYERWKTHIRSWEVAMSKATRIIKNAYLPRLKRIWWNSISERFDGSPVALEARFQRHELKLEGDRFQIVRTKDRAAYDL